MIENAPSPDEFGAAQVTLMYYTHLIEIDGVPTRLIPIASPRRNRLSPQLKPLRMPRFAGVYSDLYAGI
jgi:hypothetical protein